MLNSKKGMSALQIQRQIGCSPTRPLGICAIDLRAAMHDPEFKQLMGIVEVDETYIGGKERIAH